MQTKLIEVLKHKGRIVHAVPPDSTVRDAVRLMNRQRIGAVMVQSEGAWVGIVTERDVLVRVLDAQLDARTTLVQDVMTTTLVTVSSDMRVGEAMRLCTERRVRHLPVVDGREQVGMVSIGDLTSWATQHLLAEVDELERYINGPSLEARV